MEWKYGNEVVWIGSMRMGLFGMGMRLCLPRVRKGLNLLCVWFRG